MYRDLSLPLPPLVDRSACPPSLLRQPENLLLDREGYVKVVDLGFAKVVDYRAYTFCGTPEYMAPEVIMGKPHYMPCDWWSIGILTFEMLTGGTPFDNSSTEESCTIFQSVLRFADSGTPAPSFPWFFNRPAKDFIQKLLVASPEGRLDANAMMAHPFLAEIDVLELERKALPAPYVPLIEDEGDTSNFDTQAYEDDSDEDDDDDDDEVRVVDSTKDSALDVRCRKAKLFPAFEALPSMNGR